VTTPSEFIDPVAQGVSDMRNLRLAIAATASIALSSCAGSSSSPSAPSPVTSTTAIVTTTTAVVRIIVAGTPPPLGTSSQFTAIAVLTDGSSQTVTSQATWLSSNTSVATVSGSGMVSARSNGSVVISATYAGTEGSLAFAVVPPATVTLSGTITDATSGSGVAATVTVKDALGGIKSAVADGAGRYSILGLAGGAVDVTAVAPNYVAITKSIMMYGDRTLDFALARVSPCPVIAFDDVGSDGAPFTTYTRCGFTVAATTSNWTVSTTYGRPAPFILFSSPHGTTTVGEVIVTAAGAKFKFQSVDLYSSTTPIPYVITGIANSATVFTIQSAQGNTFGNFATVVNPNPTMQIDALVIRLSNPAAPCCSNPMGLDNIVIAY
jgi:hypothetical protein